MAVQDAWDLAQQLVNGGHSCPGGHQPVRGRGRAEVRGRHQHQPQDDRCGPLRENSHGVISGVISR
jgi:hypothetical protein